MSWSRRPPRRRGPHNWPRIDDPAGGSYPGILSQHSDERLLAINPVPTKPRTVHHDDRRDPLARRFRGNLFGGSIVFAVAAAMLASMFYALPFITTPYGYTSYLRLDDVVFLFLAPTVIFGTRNAFAALGSRVGRLILSVTIMAVISLLASSILNGINPLSVWAVLRYVNYFLVFVFASRIPLSPPRLRMLMWIVFFGGVFVSIYGFAQYYDYIHPDYYTDVFEGRGQGWAAAVEGGRFRYLLGPLSHNHAHAGMVLGTVAIFSWALFARSPGSGKLLLLAGSPAILWALLLTGARSPLYSLIIVIAGASFFVRRHMLPTLLTGTLVAVLWTTGYFAQTVFERLSFVGEENVTSGRADGWVALVEWIGTHPHQLLFGIGVGRFSEMLGGVVGLNAAHNTYLQVLVEQGVIALVLFVSAHLQVLKVSHRLARSSDLETAGFGRAMFVSEIFWLISSLSQENFTPNVALGNFMGFSLFLQGLVNNVSQTAIARGTVKAG